MKFPMEWTHNVPISKIKLSRPAGDVFAVRIEVADASGTILGSTVGSGTTIPSAIENAKERLPEGLR